jgi:hypothetical protein
MNRLKIFGAICLLFIINACNRANSDPYEGAIKRYFSEVLSMTFEENKAYTDVLIIPLSGCTPCLAEVMEHLTNRRPSQNQIVLVGESQNMEIKRMVEELSTTYSVFVDLDYSLTGYRTNITGPSLLRIEDGHIEKTEITLLNYTTVLNF